MVSHSTTWARRSLLAASSQRAVVAPGGSSPPCAAIARRVTGSHANLVSSSGWLSSTTPLQGYIVDEETLFESGCPFDVCLGRKCLGLAVSIAGLHLQDMLAVLEKRLSPLPVVRKIDICQFIPVEDGETTPSGPDEEFVGKALVGVEMTPCVTHLPKEHVESSGRILPSAQAVAKAPSSSGPVRSCSTGYTFNPRPLNVVVNFRWSSSLRASLTVSGLICRKRSGWFPMRETGTSQRCLSVLKTPPSPNHSSVVNQYFSGDMTRHDQGWP